MFVPHSPAPQVVVPDDTEPLGWLNGSDGDGWGNRLARPRDVRLRYLTPIAQAAALFAPAGVVAYPDPASYAQMGGALYGTR